METVASDARPVRTAATIPLATVSEEQKSLAPFRASPDMMAVCPRELDL